MSDQYAVLEILDAPVGEGKPIKGLSNTKGKIRTKTVKKTLNPKWQDEEFHFEHPPKGSWLTVTLWDDDLMGDDKLGTICWSESLVGSFRAPSGAE